MKIIIIAAFILIFVLFYFFEKKRSDELQVAAQQMGFSLDRGQQPLPQALKNADFYLLTQGSNSIRNQLSGTQEGYEIILAEYFFDAEFGGEADPHIPNSDNDGMIDQHAQMFAWIKKSGTRLPEFDLSPTDSTVRSAASNAGYNSLQFDNAQQFNKVFNLAGNEAQPIRDLFTPKMREMLLQYPTLVWESKGDQWLFYAPDNRVPAQKLPAFVNHLIQLLQQHENTST